MGNTTAPFTCPAYDLQPTDVIELKGDRYTVERVRNAANDSVILTIVDVDGDRFQRTVPADRDFLVVVEGRYDGDPAADDRGHVHRDPVLDMPSVDGHGRPITWRRDDDPARPSEINAGGPPSAGGPFSARPTVEDAVAATIPGTDIDADGTLVFPPMNAVTGLAHLVLLHGKRWDGVTLADAKRVADGRAISMDEAFRRATLEHAMKIHEQLHAAGDLLVPHRHRDA